ncbi:hypothetical protein Ocin01_12521 [Orchesella cincta]|uniref:Uncharacterized protein n=1 Tax=Orchesella cincta TaxID=48709 RepID=A0A1D2MMH5_ORCCI|nr:hypothetical protein Ocin01_12521 [Orchesella cincta]
MKTIIFAVGIIAVLCCATSVSSENLVSTLRIVAKLCYIPGNSKNQTLINDFFACYDTAPGKDLFVKCQTKMFGGPMDNVPVVAGSCTQPQKIPTYGICLTNEFRAAGLDMNAAVKTLNACQMKALNIRSCDL